MLVIKTLKALKDNFIYLIHEKDEGLTAVIDPSEAQVVLNCLKENSWNLDYIWNTHHHWDHTGGNAELQRITHRKIWASTFDSNRIPPKIDRGLKDREEFQFGKLRVQILEIPGHTLGHIAFHLPDEKILFTGDTLFSFGCGRIFEGTHEQMHSSLLKLAGLAPETQIYCGHEYTLNNIDFALSLNPKNKNLMELRKQIESKIKDQGHSMPSLLSQELKENPFLNANSFEEFKRRRKLKDSFS